MNTSLRRRGLTLLETMIALAIMAVLGAMAAPSLGSSMARHRVKAAAGHLAADLGEARHEATRRGTLMHVTFQAGSDWCYAITIDPQATCATTGSAVLKRVSAKDHPGVTMVQAQTIEFNGPRGTGPETPAQVQLVSARGDQLQVRVSLLGRAKVCSPDGALADVPHC